MNNSVINENALQSIKDIHTLSQRYNALVKKNHNDRLLEMMRHHIDEIEELFRKGDKHSFVEAGDLIILCCELLLENNQDVDKMLVQCFKRFETKLNGLLEEASGESG